MRKRSESGAKVEPVDGPEGAAGIAKAHHRLNPEEKARLRRYLLSMAFRTACVIAAIVVPGWPKALFIVAAIVLPYISVVAINAGRESAKPGDLGADGIPHVRVALDASTAPAPGMWRELVSSFTHIYPRHK